jgi:hypothetical protein
MATRKVRIFEHISLDGVMQPRGDSDFANGGWLAPYRSPVGAVAFVEAQGTSFDLLPVPPKKDFHFSRDKRPSGEHR